MLFSVDSSLECLICTKFCVGRIFFCAASACYNFFLFNRNDYAVSFYLELSYVDAIHLIPDHFRYTAFAHTKGLLPWLHISFNRIFAPKLKLVAGKKIVCKSNKGQNSWNGFATLIGYSYFVAIKLVLVAAAFFVI